MENNIQVFNNAEFGEVRTVVINNEPWFVGKDVATALGYTDTAHSLLDHVDDEDRVNSKTQGQNNPEFGQRGCWLINESGLYSLVLGSKAPKAKEFKRWVTSVVLPSIRKNGGYIAGQEELTPEQIVAKALIVANKIIEEKDRQLAEANEKTKFLESTIEEQKPKVSYYDIVLQNNSLTPITVIAKDYGMSAVKFNNVLSELKVQYKVNGTWVLYQDYANCGYTGTKTGLTKVGTAYVQTQWTQSGRRFIYDVLKSKMNILPLVER